MQTEEILLTAIVASVIYVALGYVIYGWWIHRKFRDNHYRIVEQEMKKQTVYLKVLAESLAAEKLDAVRREKEGVK